MNLLRPAVKLAGLAVPLLALVLLPPTADSLAGSPERVLAGKIVWADGGPFMGEQVFLRAIEPGGAGDEPELREIVGGRFRFTDLPAKRYRLSITERIGKTLAEPASWTVTTGSEDLVLRIPSIPDRPFVAVQVLDPEDRPVFTATLLVEALGDFGRPRDERREVIEGWSRFALLLPAERFLLTIVAGRASDGRRLGARTLGPLEVSAEPIRVSMPWENPIRGKVVDHVTGEPIPRCRVRASLAAPTLTWLGANTDGIHEAQSETDGSGRFGIPGFAGDRIHLAVVPPPPWFAPDPFPLPDASDLRLEVRMGVTPAVTVVDEKGNGIASAGVRVTDGPIGWRSFGTNRDGVARIGPLDPDREYSLDVHAPIGSTGLSGASSYPWRPADITLTLEKKPVVPRPKPPRPAPDSPFAGRSTLHLHLLNWPNWNEHVSVQTGELSCDQKPVQVRNFEFSPNLTDHRVEIHGLRPDRTYTVRIWGVGSGLVVAKSGLKPGIGRHRLRLVRGETISGRIDLPQGAHYARFDVTRNGIECWLGSLAIVRPDGRFEIRGLLPGTWTLDLSVGAGDRWFSAKAEARTGTEIRITPRELGK